MISILAKKLLQDLQSRNERMFLLTFTIVNLAPMNDSFNLILCPGKMLDVGLENGAYKSSTQGWFKPGKPLPQFLKEYSLAGGTHHSAMVYDVDIEELKAFGQMMGFNVIVVE